MPWHPPILSPFPGHGAHRKCAIHYVLPGQVVLTWCQIVLLTGLFYFWQLLFCALSVFTVNWPSSFPLENRCHIAIMAAWNNHMRSCWTRMFSGCYKHRESCVCACLLLLWSSNCCFLLYGCILLLCGVLVVNLMAESVMWCTPGVPCGWRPSGNSGSSGCRGHGGSACPRQTQHPHICLAIL